MEYTECEDSLCKFHESLTSLIKQLYLWFYIALSSYSFRIHMFSLLPVQACEGKEPARPIVYGAEQVCKTKNFWHDFASWNWGMGECGKWNFFLEWSTLITRVIQFQLLKYMLMPCFEMDRFQWYRAFILYTWNASYISNSRSLPRSVFGWPVSAILPDRFVDIMGSADPPVLNELFWCLLHLNCPKVSFSKRFFHGEIWFHFWSKLIVTMMKWLLPYYFPGI